VRSDNDALMRFGLAPNVDGDALADMATTDCWAWHRRPLAPRARVAAARHAIALMGAYDTVLKAIGVVMGQPIHADPSPSHDARSDQRQATADAESDAAGRREHNVCP